MSSPLFEIIGLAAFVLALKMSSPLFTITDLTASTAFGATLAHPVWNTIQMATSAKKHFLTILVSLPQNPLLKILLLQLSLQRNTLGHYFCLANYFPATNTITFKISHLNSTMNTALIQGGQ